MIIIDKEAPQKLMPILERIKEKSGHARSIFFNLKADKAAAENASKIIFATAPSYLESSYTQIFVCDDGDIFIIAPTIPSKHGKEFIEAVACQLGKAVEDEWVRFLEVPLHLHVLLYEVNSKLDKLQQNEEAQHKLVAEQKNQSKREAILNGAAVKNKEEIILRRLNRKQPEIMIIEDDVFSRRLVENTLQKKYPLTGLGEASYALETYARIAPNVLFLDINLPDVTGHELLERIVAIDPQAYVVMLSGNSDKHNITHAMNKGAKGFVAKPFTKEKLLHYIEHCPTIHQHKE